MILIHDLSRREGLEVNAREYVVTNFGWYLCLEIHVMENIGYCTNISFFSENNSHVLRLGAMMPVLSVFFGIIIRMWHDDHPPPHIHAAYQGFEALVDIRSGMILEGKLPKKAAKLVKDWCLVHQEELFDNWKLAQQFEPLVRIPGADYDD